MESPTHQEKGTAELVGMRGKRVLFAITKSNWGGAQSYVHTLASQFHAQGADVAVAVGGTGVAGSETGLLAQRLKASGVRVVPLTKIARDIGMLQEFRAFFELVHIIRSERPDVLHLNSSKAGALGSLAGRIAGIPRIVFTAHGWPHREPVDLLGRAVRWLGSWATIVLAHKVIVVSDCDFQTSPVLFSRRKIATIHNGIAPFTLQPRVAARKALIERAPELRDTVPWLVMLAELHTNKGIDTAISALAKLTVFPDTALIVLGEGEQRATLMKHAKACGVADRVFLLGFVPDARAHLLAADVFLMPSRKEGFPMALLEAGSAGLSVIVSRVGGMPEIVNDGTTGLLVNPDDATDLAAACASLLNDPAYANELGATFQESVRSGFTEETMVPQTASTYALK
jgi:glycosyltransferase involved in cell wall biosynthesis